MIVLLDTSTPTCKLTLVNGDETFYHEWESGRGLAKGLLAYLRDSFAEHGLSWEDISALGVYKGPGSFTGLRISVTVMNTLADSRSVPIVGETGDDWKERAQARLNAGENDRIVLPEYGGEANITTPRK